MKIGRKIYFEKSTGNFILDAGERSGDVIETTQDQDFQFYTVLQPYLQSAVGVIQCDYGYQSDNFAKYPYHIDITKNPIDQTAIVWDTANPYGATLAQVQSQKIAQITDLYNQKLANGFTSSATGTPHKFGYASSDQMKFMQLAILVLSGMVVWPYKIRNKDGVDIPHTQAQYQALLIDIATFAQEQNVLEGDYFDRVNACVAVDEVNAIVVSF